MDNRTISELRNLGPACQRDLNSVGIFNLNDLRKFGVEETYHRILIGRIQRAEATKSPSAIYLYALYGALHDLDWREIPEKKKQEFKKLAAELRQQHFRCGANTSTQG
jgi:hypothetical protein